MKYTKELLSVISSMQIDIAIAKTVYPEAELIQASQGMAYILHNKRNKWELKSWVSDDSEAFRLMVDNKISLTWDDEFNTWDASELFEIVELEYESPVIKLGKISSNENPNRAIAECFLLMQGGES